MKHLKNYIHIHKIIYCIKPDKFVRLLLITTHNCKINPQNSIYIDAMWK